MGRRRAVGIAATGALALVSCGSSDGTSQPDTSGEVPGSAATAADADATCPADGEEWEVAKVYIEHNATDADTGLHGFVGGEPWRSVCVTAPDGTQLWAISPADRLGELGVSDFFWESNEPPDDEYSIDDLRADFPEGTYLVAGTGIDGVDRLGEATFTHDIPAAPEIIEPPLVDDVEDEEPPVVDASGLIIRWEPVSATIDGDPVDITGYQVIVTDEEAEDEDGWARPISDVHVDPDATELPVPDEFVQPDTLYEVEVLAIEASGNQTISVGFFRTAGT